MKRFRFAFLPVLVAGCLGAWASSETKSPPAEPTTSKAQKLVQQVRCEGLPQQSPKELWDLAQCYQRIGNNLQAVQALREVSRRDPQDLEAAFVTSWLLWTEGQRVGGASESQRTQEALEELQKARLANPTHWKVDAEIGDFFFLRVQSPEGAYAEYLKARTHYEGDYSKSVPSAPAGMKSSIENRIARSADLLGRKGEAVESSCRALVYDPDDNEAKKRIERHAGSCVRKDLKELRELQRKELAKPAAGAR